MSWIKKAKEEQFKAIELKDLRKNLRVLHQVGKTNIEKDKLRKALMPGKRISKTGKVYWETRKNRSDLKGKV